MDKEIVFAMFFLRYKSQTRHSKNAKKCEKSEIKCWLIWCEKLYNDRGNELGSMRFTRIWLKFHIPLIVGKFQWNIIWIVDSVTRNRISSRAKKINLNWPCTVKSKELYKKPITQKVILLFNILKKLCQFKKARLFPWAGQNCH